MATLERFECKKCGQCCIGDGIVILKDEDINRISDYLKIDREIFLREYATMAGNEYWVKDKENKACVFLKGNGCSIHSVKPIQCRDYPDKWRSTRLINFCEGFKTETE
jgi:hypothetical protein